MPAIEYGPIAGDWKISKVLEVHPDLLETLVALTPAFAKLKNPILRKVQSRLVTVEQAAGIAGIDPQVLVDRLNTAAGIETSGLVKQPASTASEAADRPGWAGAASVAQEVDARAMLARGEEPFWAITLAARQVPVGEVMRIHAAFAPVPLYEALAKQGFEHWAEHRGDGYWVVDFHRLRAAGGTQRSSPHQTDSDWETIATAEVTIDVSELVPPEPMMKILATLEHLPAGSTLLVHHVRRPMHLYPQLDDLGFRHVTRDVGPQQVELLIHKPLAVGEHR